MLFVSRGLPEGGGGSQAAAGLGWLAAAVLRLGLRSRAAAGGRRTSWLAGFTARGRGRGPGAGRGDHPWSGRGRLRPAAGTGVRLRSGGQGSAGRFSEAVRSRLVG